VSIILNHKAHTNKNNTKIPFNKSKWLSWRKQTTINVGEDAGEKEPLYTIGEM
jgi:hypothetical protein